MYLRIIFFAWLFAITFISLVDYSSASWLDLSKEFGTGFWLHTLGYFIAGSLYFLAFGNRRQRVVLIIFFVLFIISAAENRCQKYFLYEYALIGCIKIRK